MPVQARIFLPVLVLAAGATLFGAAGGQSEPTLRLVVFGDSFTAAADMQFLRDDPAISWATGERLEQPSIRQRLEAEGFQVESTNRAVSGHRIGDLHKQLDGAPDQADLVLVWLGINDLCLDPKPSGALWADARSALGALRDKYPRADVLVFSPPSLTTIATHQRTVRPASELWGSADVCKDYFTKQSSPARAKARQAEVQVVVREVARENGMAHSPALASLDRPVSEWTAWDYFHPSPAGSAWFAEKAWPDVRRTLSAPQP